MSPFPSKEGERSEEKASVESQPGGGGGLTLEEEAMTHNALQHTYKENTDYNLTFNPTRYLMLNT